MNQKDFEASLQKGQEVRLRWRGKLSLQQCSASTIFDSVVTKEEMEDIPVGYAVLVDRAISGRRSASNLRQAAGLNSTNTLF